MSDNNNYNKRDPQNFKLNIEEDDFDKVPLEDFGSNGINYTRDIRGERKSDPYHNDVKEKSVKKEHKKRDKIKSHKNRRVFRVVWLAMVVLVALSLASYLIGGSNDFFAIGRPEGNVVIDVPENVTLEQLTDILDEAKVIDKPEFFKIYCGITTEMKYFESGRYSIATNMDYEGIINFLQEGQDNQEVVELQFTEGMNIMQMAKLFEENGVATVEEILAAAKTTDFDKFDMISQISNTSDKYYKLEGYLFPDTYNFYVNEDVDTVLSKMLNNFQGRITKDVLEDIDNSDYSLDQIITLASIIQLEAADVQDMYKVSAVLHNRLENGESRDIYSLDCDSTTYYPYKTKEDAPAGYVSNYNTYDFEGLPAGPICSPSLDAIKAAISPSEEGYDDYYFCHDAEGNAYYASTAEGHTENLAAAGLLD